MARRINTRFVAILALVIVMIVGAIVAAQRFLIHDHADQFIAQGRQDMQDRKWTEAAEDYRHAARLSPHDPKIQMMLGEALHNLTSADAEKIYQEKQAYEKALEIDPNYLPALQALVVWCQTSRLRPDAALYRALIDYSRRAYALDPSQTTLAAVPAMAVLDQNLAGIETEQKDINDATNELRGLMEKFPDQADIPYTMAMAKIQQAREVVRESTGRQQPPEATALFQEASGFFEKIFSGADGGPQDNNARMHWRYAQVLENLSISDRSAPGLQKKYIEEAQNQIDRARALVKEKDASFLDINQYAVELSTRREDPAAAIRILRGLPQNPNVQLMLARLLGNVHETRPEAESILEATLKMLPVETEDMGAFRFPFMDALTKLWIDDFSESTDAAEKARLKAQIHESIARMTEKRGNSSDMLEVTRLDARMMLCEGKFVDAIPVLSHLIADDPRAGTDAQTLILLAQAYDSAQQTGKAINYLSDLVHQHPDAMDARLYLVKLLLKHDPSAAAEHIDILEKKTPDDPRVINYRIELLQMNRDKNKDEIKKYFDRLPEDTDTHTLEKAQCAVSMQNWPDSIRLLGTYVDRHPTAVHEAISLARIYAGTGEKDKALERATAALKDNPSNDELKLLIPMIKGEDPAAIQKLREELVSQNTDPVVREEGEANLAYEHNDFAGFESHMKAAEKLAPNDPKIWDKLFQGYLQVNRLDDAAVYCDKLAAVNYDSADGLLYKFRMARARGDNNTALSIAKQLRQDRPEFAPTWMSLGEVLQAMGQYDEAIPQYGIALEKQTDNIAAIQHIVECEYALGRRDDALHSITDGLSKFPNDETLRRLLLVHQLNYGSIEDALPAIQREKDQNPNNPQLWAAQGETYLRAYRIYESSHRHDDAVAVMKKAMDVLTEAHKNWPDEPEIYTTLAEALTESNQLKEAEALLKEWGARDAWKTRIEPQLKLVDFYELTKQPDASEAAMRAVVKQWNSRVDLQIKLATLLAEHKKYDEALELLGKDHADDLSVRRAMIGILASAGRLDQAEAAIQKMIGTNPESKGEMLVFWAKVLLDHKQFDGAVAKATEALAADPKQIQAYFVRATALMSKTPGDFAAALQDLNQLQDQPDAHIRTMIGECELRLGKLDEAASALESALKANPSDKPTRMRLLGIYTSGGHVRFAEAMHLLKDVDATAPFNTDPEIFQDEAMLYGSHNDLSSALDASRKARQFAPENSEVLRTYMDLMLRTGNSSDLLKEIVPLAKANEKYWWFMIDRGAAKKVTNDMDGARTDMNKGLALAQASNDLPATNAATQAIAQVLGFDEAIQSITPYAKDKFSSKVSLSILEMQKGDQQAAVRCADDLVASAAPLSDTDKFTAYACAAHIYAGKKPQPLVDKAFDAYQKALLVRPNDPGILNDTACLLVDSYDPPRASDALPYAQKAVDTMNQAGTLDPNILETLGWIQVLNGAADQGVLKLQRVEEMRPIPVAYLHLGEGYLKMSFPEEGMSQGKKGLALLDKMKIAQGNDNGLRAKLNDLINRCDEIMKSKQQAHAQ